MNEKFELLIKSFIETKVGISDNFLSKSLSKILQENIKQLNDEGRLVNAGTGNRKDKNQDKKIRGDKIFWIEKKNKFENEKEFIEQIEDFIDYINKTCFTNIKSYEFHYSLYETGTFYKIHKDQFKSDNSRKFSLISYLNENWSEEDGGQLLIYQENGLPKIKKISPNTCKAVFFQSDELEHEVTTTNKERMSISGWLKN